MSGGLFAWATKLVNTYIHMLLNKISLLLCPLIDTGSSSRGGASQSFPHLWWKTNSYCDFIMALL